MNIESVRFIYAQNCKHLCSKVFRFSLSFENARKKLLNLQTFFVIFYIVQREDDHR